VHSFSRLAVFGLAVSLTGCGGHGTFTGPATTSSTQAKAAPKAAPSGPLTRSRAQAFARAVNLTARDLPGFTASRAGAERESATERRLQRRFLVCIGRRPSTVGSGSSEVGSPKFSRAGVLDEGVSSSVSFLASGSVAAEELALLRSARARSCLSSYLQQLFAGRHYGRVSIRYVKISQGVPPAPGSTGGFAWRIRAGVALRGVLAPFYLDVLGFIYHRAEVRLSSTGLLVPFPAAAQEHLFRLLLRRAEAAPL
jgi:hypothetical protein